MGLLPRTEREETVAESERGGGGGGGGGGNGGRNRVEFWDKPLIPGSARRRSSLVLQGNDIQRFVHGISKVLFNSVLSGLHDNNSYLSSHFTLFIVSDRLDYPSENQVKFPTNMSINK